MTAAEPSHKVRKLADEWKQPFQKEYTERSVNQAFEKLLGLRTDVEAAIEKMAAKISDRHVIDAASGLQPGNQNAIPLEVTANSSSNIPQRYTPEPPAKGDVPAALDFEACMEQIWEQLIATPPRVAGRMTTVKIADYAHPVVLLGSRGIRQRKRAVPLKIFAAQSRRVPWFPPQPRSPRKKATHSHWIRRWRSDAWKLRGCRTASMLPRQAKDTEAAVNLGISTKRLLSALDEAEKFRLHHTFPGNCGATIPWSGLDFAERQRSDSHR